MVNQTKEMFAKILVIMLKELQCWINEYLATLLRSFGIETMKLQGMLSGQSAPDPYLVMGLEKSATNDEVKIRYRELVRNLHPDTAGIKGTAYFFNLVMVAYQMIKAERSWK